MDRKEAIKKLKYIRFNAYKYYPSYLLDEVTGAIKAATDEMQEGDPVLDALIDLKSTNPDAKLIHEGDKWLVKDLIDEVKGNSESGVRFRKEVYAKIMKVMLDESNNSNDPDYHEYY